MFKYFNPVWIIKNFLQPSLGPEILIPAAIGAVGSAATGGSPITGALLGGATGGILGGAGQAVIYFQDLKVHYLLLLLV